MKTKDGFLDLQKNVSRFKFKSVGILFLDSCCCFAIKLSMVTMATGDVLGIASVALLLLFGVLRNANDADR